ncbi:MAG TPA: hypothetical protein VMO24_05675, partial [Woeseiaceae bacterium]|nr:hypothetical protein [Woeseiaceae bacterium]
MIRTIVAVTMLMFAASSAVAETTAFVNVNVLPMTSETVLRERTVIVSGNRISAIGSVIDTPVPEGAQVIDGT